MNRMIDIEGLKKELEGRRERMRGLEPHSDFRRGMLTAYNEMIATIKSIQEGKDEGLDAGLYFF